MSSLHKNIDEQPERSFENQKYEDSLEMLDKLDCLIADYARTAMLTRAQCLMKLGRLEEALQVCEKLNSNLGDARGRDLAEAKSLVSLETRQKAETESASPTGKRRVYKRLLFAAAIVAVACIVAVGVAYQMLGRDDSAPLVSNLVAAATDPPDAAPAPPAPAQEGESPLRVRGMDVDNLGSLSPTSDADGPSLYDAIKLRREMGQQESNPAPERKAPAPSAPAASAPVVEPSPKPEGPKAVETPKPAEAAKPAETPPAKPKADAGRPSGASVLDIQPFLAKQTLVNAHGDQITLTSVNSKVGAWYVLDINVGGQRATRHLEVPALNGDPALRPQLALYRDGLMLAMPGQDPKVLPLWGNNSQQDVVQAANVAGSSAGLPETPVLPDVLKPDHVFTSPYTAICDGALLVRTQKPGSSTKMETATDLLRTTRVGEWFVSKAKPYLIQEPEVGEDLQAANGASHSAGDLAPKDALVEESGKNLYSPSANIGIKADVPDNRYFYGKWYKSVDHAGVFVSLMKAAVVKKEIMESYKGRVGAIGTHDHKKHEAEALVYLVAFDLDNFRFGFTMGAEHPKVDWSAKVGNHGKSKGPDGFDTKKPLATIGAIPPYFGPYVEGTFTGGFKRDHGAFVSGPYAKVNNNSHFGFMEEGAIFSTLQPNLATVVIQRDGRLDLMTWPEDSSAILPTLAHARQNCVPIIEGIDANGSIPGAFVNNWGAGAWSGDQFGDCLSLRASLAIQENNHHRFLIFAYFTGATPNAMARVFQAYQCSYAMLLDMNTPNYCYCALYGHDHESAADAQYLHKDMACGNGNDGSLKFLQKNDTRDFFYILREPTRN